MHIVRVKLPRSLLMPRRHMDPLRGLRPTNVLSWST
jgi:hypothetical protein